MTRTIGKLRTSIRPTVVAVFFLATTLTAALAIGLQYYFGQAMARQNAAKLYTAAAASISKELDNISNVNDNIMALLVDNPVLAQVGNQQTQLRLFTSVLTKNPLYYGIYLGRADGSFFEVINLNNNSYSRESFRAIPSDRWLVLNVRSTPTGNLRTFTYIDKTLQTRLTRSEPTDYDVVERPWYKAAIESEALTTTEPYLFAQSGVPGQTLSRHIAGTGTVVGIDMTISTISTFLKEHAAVEKSEIYLYNSDGEVMASSLDSEIQSAAPALLALSLTAAEIDYIRTLPVLKVSNELDWPPFDFAQSGQPKGYSIDLIAMLGQMTGIKFKFVNGFPWPELKRQYQRGEIDLLQSVALTESNRSLGLPGLAYAALPYALATSMSSDAPGNLAQMAGKSLAIPSGWSIIPTVQAKFPAINIVEASSTLHALELVASGEVDAALDNEIIMRYIGRHYFLDNIQYRSGIQPGNETFPDTLHIFVHEDKPQLRAILDKAIAAISPAQRAYLDNTWFNFEDDARGKRSSVVPDSTMVKLALETGAHRQLVESPLAGQNWLLYIASITGSGATSQPLYLGIRAPLAQVVAPFMEEVKLSVAVTTVFLLLLIPLSWFFANPIVLPIRQLAAENDKVRRRDYAQVARVRSRVLELDELSESMVNMVEAIKAHELAQRKLMDSFIELIAQAIDDKSAYTGGHCKRVPELALMLAKRASDSTLPAFRGFELSTDDQWREYRIAAWLHDCGKITTPEHIVDKGTKLETIYNRIHEVRMRFEVLWRDAEVRYLKVVLNQPQLQHEAEQEFETMKKQLIDDFLFVAQCNVGGEFLGEEEQARLRTIANTPWQRHFDDRVGLSPTEEMRQPTAAQDLPATELLLADKPEHLVLRAASTDYPPEFGINMEVPAFLGNLGEVYNLSISRGTLTAEDRFRINEHMISTIKMLESLPFPSELSKVPRYASTHHETLSGSGYPRKLPAEELSIPERILAVADIFEALTASDRPYKKAKSISEAIDILHRMVLENHIDKDCFELFITEKVYLQYAREFLDPGQIDEVDVGKYVAGAV